MYKKDNRIRENGRTATFDQHIQIPPWPIMLPIFHADNFKIWTPPSRTKRPLSNPPYLHEHAPPNKPSLTKPPQPSLPQALPLPNHQLPARPPAEVCVHASSAPPSITARSPQPTSQKSSRLHPDTTTTTSALSQHTERREQFPRNRASPSPTSDLALSREVPEALNVSVDAPFYPDDASRYISSPSVSSSDESWRELLQFADKQNVIPIDPVILTNNGPWETEDERQHIGADSDAVISDTTYPYPDPPPLLHDVPAQYRHSNRCPGVRERSSRPERPPPHQSHAQVSADNNDPEAHIHASDNLTEVPKNDTQSKPRKRKSQASHGRPQQCKRVRKSSAIVSTKSSFSSLCSHFTSASVGVQLQFLSWLFEGALSRCLYQSDSEAPERVASPARHLTQSTDSAELHGASRKGMPYSSEERDLLLKLRRDEKRPWSEVIKLFSEQFPGRSPGAIQVFWSTTIKNMSH